MSGRRRVFVSAAKILRELASLPPLKIDYITFSGAGEPTLAKNLGDMIKKVRRVRPEKIAVITNSSLMGRKDVRKDLMNADFVIAKLDASSQKGLELMNNPAKGVTYKGIINGIKRFRGDFGGKLALQVMFTAKNMGCASGIARAAAGIGPNEIQVNTPLRPCGEKPLPRKELDKIKRIIAGYAGPAVRVIGVYDGKKRKVRPFSSQETLRRRGKI
jgi:wyosine [tRNA(Phe)-imidazoG37] synthetase (radical SAM superfamily)